AKIGNVARSASRRQCDRLGVGIVLILRSSGFKDQVNFFLPAPAQDPNRDMLLHLKVWRKAVGKRGDHGFSPDREKDISGFDTGPIGHATWKNVFESPVWLIFDCPDCKTCVNRTR